jgi:hypothetical protein
VLEGGSCVVVDLGSPRNRWAFSVGNGIRMVLQLDGKRNGRKKKNMLFSKSQLWAKRVLEARCAGRWIETDAWRMI